MKFLFSFYLITLWVGVFSPSFSEDKMPNDYNCEFTFDTYKEDLKNPIKSINDNMIELENGSTWLLHPLDKVHWNVGDKLIFQVGLSAHLCDLTNITTSKSLNLVTLIKTPEEPNPATHFIANIYRKDFLAGIGTWLSNEIEFENGSCYTVSWTQYDKLNRWSIGDMIMVVRGPNYGPYGPHWAQLMFINLTLKECMLADYRAGYTYPIDWNKP